MANNSFYRRAETWLEERLWAYKKQGRTVSTEMLLTQFADYAGTRFKKRTKERLEKIAARVRNRIIKRNSAWLKKRPKYAEELGVSEKLIQRWFVLGWISMENEWQMSMENLLKLMRERYFVLSRPNFPDEMIDYDRERCLFGE